MFCLRKKVKSDRVEQSHLTKGICLNVCLSLMISLMAVYCLYNVEQSKQSFQDSRCSAIKVADMFT